MTQSKRAAERVPADDPVFVLAGMLSMAWFKYRRIFGEAPHGTIEQMSALIELTGGEAALRRFSSFTLARQRKGRKR